VTYIKSAAGKDPADG